MSLFALLEAEEQWVLLLGQQHPQASTIQKARSLYYQNCSHWRWALVHQRAMQHTLAPLCLQHIQKMPETAQPPADIQHQWLMLKQRYTAGAIARKYALQQLAEAWKQAGIAYIPLKGMALVDYLYHDLGHRAIGDLDLLIAPKDLINAKNAAEHAGAVLVKDNGFSDLVHDPYGLKYQQLLVELHQHIHNKTQSYHVSMQDLWQSAKIDPKLPGLGYRQPHEYLIEHLCLHLYVHLYGSHRMKWAWFTDISDYLRRYGQALDPIVFRNLLATHNSSTEVKQVLGVLMQWVDEDIKRIIQALIPTCAQELNPKMLQLAVYSFQDKMDERSDQLELERRTFAVHHFKKGFKRLGWRQRIIFVLQRLFPAPRHLYARYNFSNPWLLPYYYIVRIYQGLHGWLRLDN